MLDIARQYGHRNVVDYLVTLGKFVMLINIYSSQYMVHSIDVCMYVCVCVRACVRACMHVCVRACMCLCMCVCGMLCYNYL